MPKSTRTIWKILRAHDRIHAARRRHHQPLDRPEPLAEIQIDFKDVGSARGDPDAKQIHQVEVFDAIDVGTSLWLMAEPSTEYHAATVFAPLLRLLERIGLPHSVRFDRDPRFRGSPGMREFPTPFVRFWYALGVKPVINPPHAPEKNAFVERLHHTVEQEYVRWHWPDSYEATQETLPPFQQHYNAVRPHQGLSCGNRPPLVAHPTLPERPPLPDDVDPDAWLTAYEGVGFTRKVKLGGEIVLDGKSYYVGKARAGQEVLAQIQSSSKALLIWHHQTLVAVRPLKGLVGQRMWLDAFVAWCEQEARAMWRVYLRQRALAHAG